MQALLAIYNMVAVLANVLFMVLIIQMIIGLLFSFNVINRSNEFLMAVYNSINMLLEPVLGPIRRKMPETGAIDFSPLVLLILMQFILIVLDAVIKGAA